MALESRTHLAVDLGIEPVSDFSLPSYVVPGEYLEIPFRVTLSADADDELYRHGVDVYFSEDQVLDASDVWSQSVEIYDGEAPFLGPILGEYTHDPVSVRVSRSLIVGTEYQVLLSVRGTSRLGGDDPAPSNNVVALPQTVTVVNKFGTFDDRSGARLVLRLSGGGGSAAFSITGAGQGEVTVLNGRFAVRVTDTDADSEVLIVATESTSPRAIPRVPLDSVTITDTLSSLNASGADLFGPLTLGGAVSAVNLGDITGPSTIEFPRSTSTSLQARHIRDVNLTAHSKISISAWSWQVSDPAYGLISAPRIGTLTISNFGLASPSSPDYFPQNFAGRLNVTGDFLNVFAPSILRIDIAGVVTGGSWRVNGSINSIAIGATTASFVLAAKGGVVRMQVTNSLRGVVAVRSLTELQVGKDVAGARVLIGTDLGTDAAIGGVGDAADRYEDGVLTRLSVGRNIANSTIAAGRRPIGDTGMFEFVKGENSRIDSLVVGNVISANSRIHAAVFGYFGGSVTARTLPIDWRTDPRFHISLPAPTATLRFSRVHPAFVRIYVDFSASTATSLPTSWASAFQVTKASGQVVGRVTGNTIWRQDTFDSSTGRHVLYFSRSDGRAFTAANNGEYTISIVPGRLTDNRGNAVTETVLGTFTIAL